MAATVSFEGIDYPLNEGETVLDALLRNGVPAPNSCRAGVCQACLMKAAPATPPPANSQQGLKDTMRLEGYFLACQCRPEGNMVVAAAGDEVWNNATIRRLERLSHDVLRVVLKPNPGSSLPDCACDGTNSLATDEATRFVYRAGQYVTLRNGNGPGAVSRSYSLASLPSCGDELELHVRHIPGGAMSGWLFHQAQPGDVVSFQGPAGGCFYVDSDPNQPLLLVGTGTGLAPLWGIVNDALQQGHKGPIHLVHGGLKPAGLYLVNELQELAQQSNGQVEYIPVVMGPDEEGAPVPDGMVTGNLLNFVSSRWPKAKGYRIFLCGHPDMVKDLRKLMFIAGASMKEIHADAFLPSVTKTP